MKTLIGILVVIVLTSASPDAGYKVGDVVKDFKLKNTNTKIVGLSDYSNSKGVVVIFDCNTCPYSQAYNTRIMELDKKLKPKGFPVVAINANDPKMSPGDSFDEMVKQANSKKYEFPYLFDETQEVARSFGATNTPHVFLLRKKGDQFEVAYIGAIDDSPRNAESAGRKYVEEAVASILAEQEIKTTKTKAIGCSIKYRK